MIVGIDESACSPAIGPVFYTGVSIPESFETVLEQDGDIQDSKRVPSDKIQEVVRRYQNTEEVQVHSVEISPSEFVDEANFNELKADAVSKIIEYFESVGDVEKGFVDNWERNKDLFFDRLSGRVRQGVLEKYVAKHRADVSVSVVSLASIFAKWRDIKYRRALSYEEGIYNTEPCNPKVVLFICDNPESERIRRSWRTYKRCERNGFDADAVFDELNYPESRLENARREYNAVLESV